MNPIQSTSTGPNYEPLLNTKEVAEMLGVSHRTVETWRINGGGPDYFRLSGHAVRYKPSVVQKFIDERRYGMTSEESSKPATMTGEE